MEISYKWQPIEDLSADPTELTNRELESLRKIWADQQKELLGHNALDEFNKRLRREWSIETGIIENVYTLDRGVTRTLIQKGIDAALIPHGASNRDSELVARIIQDHYETLEGMFDFVGGQRQLSTGYIKELHAALLRNQHSHTVVDQFGQAFERPLEKGAYKTLPNSPTRPNGTLHEYCPPEHVAAEMDRLVDMHTAHTGLNYPPEIEAAWLHHRFTQIHPFADGNGRVARALASLIFIKAEWFPLIVKRDDFPQYVSALEKADRGDLRPLVLLFIDAQREALFQATEVAYDVRPTETLDEAIAALRAKLVSRGTVPLKDWLRSKETAGQLVNAATARFNSLTQRLSAELGPTAKLSLGVQTVNGTLDAARLPAIEQAGQTPDFAEFNTSVALSLQSTRIDFLALSFHGIGPRFRGLIGIVGYLSLGGNPAPVPLPITPFQINYQEELGTAEARFSEWLENFLIAGLAEWRRSL